MTQTGVYFFDRNEDFFWLRWGGAGYIREHIATNGLPYVGGYAVGSEGSIPALDYTTREEQTQWIYQKQWLFHHLWGRLMFEPTTPDTVFAAMFDRRYNMSGSDWGSTMLQAYELVSIVPLRLCSFVYNTVSTRV